MKKTTLIKSLPFFIALFCAVNFGFGQTTLAAGDIIITGVNSDDNDQFAFVLLKDITSGTKLNFTDFGWLASGSFFTNSNGGPNEGVVTWTAGSNLSCGTEIIISNTTGSNYIATSGTASQTDAGFGLATDGDQILVYQGTLTSPTFIYAIHFASNTGWTNATSANTSAVPTGLTNGANAVYLGNFDNGNYNCSVTSGQSLILAAASTASNWFRTNTRIPTLGGCTYTCVACPTTVTWDGSNWTPSLPDINKNAVIAANYDTATSSIGSFSACSLTVNNDVSLSINDVTNGAPTNTYVEVANDVTVLGTGSILVNPNASFVQISDTGTVTLSPDGSIQVEKLTAPMNAWYEYTYWSSPVSGAKIATAIPESPANRRYKLNGQNFLDHCAETNNNNICDDNGGLGLQDDIDDNGDDWEWIPGDTEMMPGIGYATTLTNFAYSSAPGTSNKTFRFTFEGPFNNGLYNVPIYRNDSELNDNNWNFIGNPYPSAIDADLFLAANSAIAQNVDGTGYIDGAIFLWSQNTAPLSTANGNQTLNFSNDDYAIINASGELAGGDGNTPSIILPSGHRAIPSGQGFFVSMSNSGGTLFSGDIWTANVTFNNSMRVKGSSDNSMFFKNTNTKSKSSSVTNKLWVNLTSDNGVFNQILVSYLNGATNDDDGMAYDTNKYPTKGAALYSIIDGSLKKFAIQGKAANSINEDETIQLGFKTTINVATLYTLSIAQLQGDFLTNNPVYLRDNLLNKVHDLSVSDYTFTSEVGEFNKRFEIVFTNKTLADTSFTTDANSVKITSLDNNSVSFKASNNLNISQVSILDMLGRTLYTFKGKSNEETFKLSNLNQNVFIAKITLSNGAVVTKKAVLK